jgi:hypothetical protein
MRSALVAAVVLLLMAGTVEYLAPVAHAQGVVSTLEPSPPSSSVTTARINQAEPGYPTANGPRTAAQLQQELLAAGYAGPWDVESMLAAYDRAAAPRIDPYPDDLKWSCFDTNPSCGRDPWWAEVNTDQSDARVTYRAIGSGFSTERRFAEAVNLLWQWPEGKTLLREADRLGVGVMTLDYDEQFAYASYVPERNVIAVNRNYVTAPTWMVAGVIAHELSHALDDARNSFSQNTAATCLARENHAFQTEQRYLVWLTRTLRPEGLPTIAAVTGSLNADRAQLARDLYSVGSSSDLSPLVERAYGPVCGGSS